MSLDGAYDPDNIFAKIVRGEIPCAKVWEDAGALAFMDVFPQSRGHTLVISKASRARNLLDAEPATLDTLIAATQKVARAVKTALSPDGIVITQFNGAPAGQTIFHLRTSTSSRASRASAAGVRTARAAWRTWPSYRRRRRRSRRRSRATRPTPPSIAPGNSALIGRPWRPVVASL